MEEDVQYRRDLWRVMYHHTEGQTIHNRLAGNVAEIGVAEGLFSFEMLKWPVMFDKLYMVDRWRCMPSVNGDSSMPQLWHEANFDMAMTRVGQDASRVVVLRGDSVDVAQKVPDGSLALVYVDADHSFRGVLSDISAWVPKLIKGGVMAFHDYENETYGVRRAVQYFAASNNLIVHRIVENKPEDAGAWFRVP